MDVLQNTGLILAWVGMGCWLVCFWWMHRISVKQETMLKELHDMTARIQEVSEREHEMLREVHPAVDHIKESVENVEAAIGEGGKAPREAVKR